MRPDSSGTRLSLLMAGAQALAALTGVAGTLLLSRLMGDAAFGQAMLLISLVTLGAVVVGGNLDAVAMRALNTGTPGTRAAFLRLTRRVIGFGGLLCLFLGTAFWTAGLIPLGSLLVLAAATPMLALLRATARQGAALGRPGVAVTVRLLARPLSFLAFAAVCLGLGASPPYWTPGAVLAAACAAGVVLQLYALRQVLRPLSVTPVGAGNARGWICAGAALAPALLMQELLRDLVLVSAGWTLDAPALGTFALALTLSALPGLAVTAVDIALGPRIGRAAAAGDAVRLSIALAQSALLRVTGLAVALLGLVLILPTALRLADAPHTQPLVWTLVAIPAARALLGNPAMLLAAAGHFTPVGWITTVGAGLTTLSVAVTGLHWGASGAAWAAVLGVGTTLAGLWIVAWKLLGQDCSALVLLNRPRRASSV